MCVFLSLYIFYMYDIEGKELEEVPANGSKKGVCVWVVDLTFLFKSFDIQQL